MALKVDVARRLPGPPVAFNTQDWWVTGAAFPGESLITVGTIHGKVFEHNIKGGEISPFTEYGGNPIAFRRPIDRWVIKRTNTYYVGLCDGSVVSHAKSFNPGPVLSEPHPETGPPVAARPEDNHVLAIGQNIAVIRHDGEVFRHRLNDPGVEPSIQPALPVQGPRVASRVQDRWVFSGQVKPGSFEIFVITSRGEVWSHTVQMINGDIKQIDEAVQLNKDGPQVGFNAQDRFVVFSDGKLVVITEDGEVWAHALIEA